MGERIRNGREDERSTDDDRRHALYLGGTIVGGILLSAATYQVVYWFATFDHDGWLMTSLQVACLLWLGFMGRHLRDGCLLGTVPQISRVAPCEWVSRSDRFRTCCRTNWTIGSDHTTERAFNDIK